MQPQYFPTKINVILKLKGEKTLKRVEKYTFYSLFLLVVAVDFKRRNFMKAKLERRKEYDMMKAQINAVERSAQTAFVVSRNILIYTQKVYD